MTWSTTWQAFASGRCGSPLPPTLGASGTVLKGGFALRCVITNHRSPRDDFELLVNEVVRLGDQLVREG
ncbi:MAG TPA: hypothetical protein VFI11_02570 [Anaerolineales bacterium]|nr:hypothetical protein [Anaerolineales bacterium]